MLSDFRVSTIQINYTKLTQRMGLPPRAFRISLTRATGLLRTNAKREERTSHACCVQIELAGQLVLL